MNIQRHHTYAARALLALLKDENDPFPPRLDALERDIDGTVEKLRARKAKVPKELRDVLKKNGHDLD